MNIHWLQHVPFEGLGCIEPWLAENGHAVSCTRLWADEKVPNTGNVDGLIVMGGPMGVYDDDQHPWLSAEKAFIKEIIDQNKPVLGICLGAQLIADVLGSNVWKNDQKEIGFFPLETKTREAGAIVTATKQSEVAMVGTSESDFSNLWKSKASRHAMASNAWKLPDEFMAFHWHGDTFGIPDGAVHLASSEATDNQAFIYNDNVFALQFHLETTEESLMDLYENGSAEIEEGPTFQCLEEMQENFPTLGTCNALMETLLEKLFTR
jgi:GMP synthase (glutamine-hydrolysing)